MQIPKNARPVSDGLARQGQMHLTAARERLRLLVGDKPDLCVDGPPKPTPPPQPAPKRPYYENDQPWLDAALSAAKGTPGVVRCGCNQASCASLLCFMQAQPAFVEDDDYFEFLVPRRPAPPPPPPPPKEGLPPRP